MVLIPLSLSFLPNVYRINNTHIQWEGNIHPLYPHLYTTRCVVEIPLPTNINTSIRCRFVLCWERSKGEEYIKQAMHLTFTQVNTWTYTKNTVEYDISQFYISELDRNRWLDVQIIQLKKKLLIFITTFKQMPRLQYYFLYFYVNIMIARIWEGKEVNCKRRTCVNHFCIFNK